MNINFNCGIRKYMSWYDDVGREFANWLHIKAKVIYISIPQHCNQLHYNFITKILPNAFIMEAGSCDQRNGLMVSIFDLYNALDKSLSYGQDNAYAVLMFPSLKGLPPEAIELMKGLIKYVQESKLRPIILNFFPQDFMYKTQLYYDDLILVSRALKDIPSQQVHDQKYHEMLRTIKSLLEPENYNKSMLELNSMLGNGPLQGQPMLFSRNIHKEFKVNFVDLLAICILMYGLICHRKVKKPKAKLN